MNRITALSFLLCLLAAPAAVAVDITLLGPTQFVRTRGRPNLYLSAFPGTAGPGKLIVRNGLANGKNRVSLAVVKVNGQVVLRPKDLNQGVFEIEKPLNLSVNNTISVKMGSKPGSFLTIEVSQELDADYAAFVGPEGGYIEFGSQARSTYRLALDIPAGALHSETLITLNQMDPEGVFDLSPHYHQVGPIVNIGPDGLVFQKPASLIISYRDGDNDGLVDGTPFDEKDLLIFSSNSNFEQFDIRGNVTDTASNISEISIHHLTSFGFWSGRWPSDSFLRYRIINTPAQTHDSPGEIKDALRSAFSEWQGHLSSVGIYFEEVAAGEDAEISIEWTSQDIGGVGLTTGYVAATSPVEIHKRIQFSDDVTACCGADVWSASLDPNNSQPNAVFVNKVAMHEIGHVLGLSHLTTQEEQMGDADRSVMHASAGTGNLQALSRIDLQKLRDRYGITEVGEVWLLEFEGTLSAPNIDYFGLNGATFTLTMQLEPETVGTFHDIGAYVLSGYRTSDFSLEIDGHGYSLNSSAAALIWDSQIGSLNDRLSVHADITDTNEAIPFDFGGGMIFSLLGIYLPTSHFNGTDMQPVSNADVVGIWPATVWRLLPSGDFETTIIGVENAQVSLRLETR